MRLFGTDGVTVRFGGLAALEDLTIELARNEILGLIGPNGAGKSTLINVLSGFQRVAGRAGLRGRPQHHRPRTPRYFPPRRCPHVPGRSPLRRPHGARERGRRLQRAAGGPPGRTTAGRRRSSIGSGLGDKAQAIAGTLPYGDERRVGIARALATAPAFLLLLDEPAAGTNEEDIPNLISMIARIRDEFDCGVLVVEHNMGLIMALCSRVHVIDHGRTIAVGSPRAVQDDPEVRRAYLGEDET